MSLHQHQIPTQNVSMHTYTLELGEHGQCPGCGHAATVLFVAELTQHEANGKFAVQLGRCADCCVHDTLMGVRIVSDDCQHVELAKENELLRAACGHLCEKLDTLQITIADQR